MLRIKKIVINNIRGIPDLELQLNSKSLVLYGENGTGKSSLVDAIEFLFTGKISHLEGTQGISVLKYGPYIKSDKSKAKVEITFSPNDIHLSRDFNEDLSPHKELLNGCLQTTQKGTFILRRAQILEFILSTPANRFASIGNIMGIGALDDTELEMKRLSDELNGLVESKENRIKELKDKLTEIIGEKNIDIKDTKSLLNKKLQDAKLPPLNSLEENEIDKYTQKILSRIKKDGNNDKRINAIKGILDITDTPLISKEIFSDLEIVNNNVEPLLSQKVKIKLYSKNLLKSGKEIIEQERSDVCPLCEQKISREILISSIDKRLRTLEQLSNKTTEIKKKSTAVIDKLKASKDNLAKIVSKAKFLPEVSEETSILNNKIRLIDNLIKSIKSAEKLENKIPTSEIKQIEEINYFVKSMSEKCKQLLKNINLTPEEKNMYNLAFLIQNVGKIYSSITKAIVEHKKIQEYYNLAYKIYTVFSGTKKSKIQEVYNAIQNDIQNFYSVLHPSEPHRNIELKIVQGRRASTEIKMESFGEKADPRALASEGHLDSLGLCIFLAFVKKFNKECPLVILDDVVTTIDAQHRNRIAKLLLTEFKDYQLIITTSDGIWYEQIINSQRALGVQGNFVNDAITNWDIYTGPRLSKYKPQWDSIQDKLNGNDKSGAGNQGRIYLEWLLKKICEQLEVPVPFKSSGKYTVSELLNAAEKRIKEKIKNTDIKKEILKKFEDVRSTAFMGNLLSHDNPETTNLSIEEVKIFCEGVHNLHGMFLCPTCGKFLKYFRDSKIIRCPDLKCKSPKIWETK